MYWVYILYSRSFHQTYIGHTNEVSQRFYRHNRGFVLSTKRYRPWEMIYTEEFTSRSEAMKREKYFKSGVGREEVKRIVEQYLRQNG
ncbi:MAG: GIY-YIG nuclease family protein [Bacteroidota bacterium]